MVLINEDLVVPPQTRFIDLMVGCAYTVCLHTYVCAVFYTNENNDLKKKLLSGNRVAKGCK
jgi:hypothetical protein